MTCLLLHFLLQSCGGRIIGWDEFTRGYKIEGSLPVQEDEEIHFKILRNCKYSEVFTKIKSNKKEALDPWKGSGQ